MSTSNPDAVKKRGKGAFNKNSTKKLFSPAGTVNQ